MNDEQIKALRKASAVLCGTGYHNEASTINSILAASASAEPVFRCNDFESFNIEQVPETMRPIEAPAQAVALSGEPISERTLRTLVYQIEDLKPSKHKDNVQNAIAILRNAFRAALSAHTSMSAEPHTDAEALAEAWQASLDYMREHKQTATPSAENRPAQDDVRDAQRYRWLKENCFDTEEAGDGDSFPHPALHFESDDLQPYNADSIDSAIDAAIASQSAKEPK